MRQQEVAEAEPPALAPPSAVIPEAAPAAAHVPQEAPQEAAHVIDEATPAAEPEIPPTEPPQLPQLRQPAPRPAPGMQMLCCGGQALRRYRYAVALEYGKQVMDSFFTNLSPVMAGAVPDLDALRSQLLQQAQRGRSPPPPQVRDVIDTAMVSTAALCSRSCSTLKVWSVAGELGGEH